MNVQFADRSMKPDRWDDLYSTLGQSILDIGSSDEKRIEDWLRQRWSYLNTYNPPINLKNLVYPAHQSVIQDTEKMVNVGRVVDGSGNNPLEWGSRHDSFMSDAVKSIQSLMKGVGFTHYDWVFSSGFLELEEIPGPTGPIYRCLSGDMLIHTLKALGAPYYPARVIRKNHPVKNDQVIVPRPPQSLVRKIIPVSSRHLKNLHKFGIVRDVAKHEDHYTMTLQRDLVTPWSLEHPDRVEIISVKYADLYPPFRHLPFYLHMIHADSWVKYLKGTGMMPDSHTS